MIIIIIIILRARRTFRKFNSLPWTKDNCRFSLSSVPLFLVSSSSAAAGSSYLASAKASSVGSNGWSDSATTLSGVAGPAATRSVCRNRRSDTGMANDEKQQQHRAANQTNVVTVVSIMPPAVEIGCSRWSSRCVINVNGRIPRDKYLCGDGRVPIRILQRRRRKRHPREYYQLKMYLRRARARVYHTGPSRGRSVESYIVSIPVLVLRQ